MRLRYTIESTLGQPGPRAGAVTGVPLAQDSALIDAGLAVNLSPGASLGVEYKGQFASHVEDDAVEGRFDWVF